MAKKTNTTEEQFANVEQTLGRTEQWVENNQQKLSLIVLSIVGVIGAFMLFNNFYVKPLNEEAEAELFHAVNYFEKDSFNLALNGDGQYYGFLDIIDEYGSSDAGNLANYYAGICYLQMGDNESAIEFLSDFSSKDEIISSLALGAIGDAYMNLDQGDQAIAHWKKAANNSSNDFTCPIYLKRTAIALEQEGQFSEALKMLNRIKTDFSKSQEADDIDKYITKIELMN